MKTVIAITAAITAAAATVAHAGQTITVDETKVTAEAKSAAKQYIETNSDEDFAVLLNALEDDSNALPLDVRVILSASADSTNARTYTPTVAGGCYSNCYSNCHGSRGWR